MGFNVYFLIVWDFDDLPKAIRENIGPSQSRTALPFIVANVDTRF